MGMSDALFSELKESRRQFLALVDDLRPDLHRYCARMVGSAADGEDIVQDTLAAAYFQLATLDELPALRAWLFRIAHNRALDHLRRYDRRMGEPLDDARELPAGEPEADAALAREQSVRAAFSRFLELAPTQRSCVILKDVLGCSLEEIAETLALSVPAIKAALHRGRTRLRALSQSSEEPVPPPSPAIARYAALFNARDWDGVRAMLAEDVRLDVVTRSKRLGQEVAPYFTNYDRFADWTLVPAWMDGREVLGVLRDPSDTQPGYFIELTFTAAGDKVAEIRDFRYVPYIAREARMTIPGSRR
jgi:RNA polymerase sigma factor (sigma-70 family)